MKLCPVAVALIVGGFCLAKPYHDDYNLPRGITGPSIVSSSHSESSASNHSSSHNIESLSTSHVTSIGDNIIKTKSTTIKKTTTTRRRVAKRTSKKSYRTKISDAVISHDFGAPVDAGASGYISTSKANAAESTSNENSPEVFKKGYRTTGLSYPSHPISGGQYSETGYDQNSKSQSVSEGTRSLTDENSQTRYSTNFIAPDLVAPEAVSSKCYSQNSKIQAADRISKTNFQETSDEGYTKTGASYPVYGRVYSGAGYDQKSKSVSGSKASRSLFREDSENGYSKNGIAPGYVASAVVSYTGYSQDSGIKADQSVSEASSKQNSNKGYTKTGVSHPVYEGVYSQTGYDQESSSNGFDNGVSVAPQFGGTVGYSGLSSTSQAQSSDKSSSDLSSISNGQSTFYNAPGFVAAPVFASRRTSSRSLSSSYKKSSHSRSQQSRSFSSVGDLGYGPYGQAASQESAHSSKSSTSRSQSEASQYSSSSADTSVNHYVPLY